jgi:hypothetical protein
MSKTQGLGWIQRYKKGKAGEGDEEAHMNLCGERMGCAIGEIEAMAFVGAFFSKEDEYEVVGTLALLLAAAPAFFCAAF